MKTVGQYEEYLSCIVNEQQMNKYLAVDCSQIDVREVGGEIVITIRATVRADPLSVHRSQVELLNQVHLGQKEEVYAQLFRSKVVEPPPPPPPLLVEEEKKEQESQEQGSKANIFGRDQNERQPQQQAPRTGSLFSSRPDDRPSNSNEPIFSKRSEQRDQRPAGSAWGNNIFSVSRPNQSSGDRGSSFMGGLSHQPISRVNSGLSGQGSRSPSQGSMSSGGSNLFFDAPQVNNPAPSLFSDPSSGSTSNYTSTTHRKPIVPRHKDKQRVF